MKESITKFDLEAAFKALDEIEIPQAEKGIKANRVALTEIFSKKSKFDALMEEYYDVSDSSDLEGAQEAREAEVAKAKLARIEKIVDLDADSPDDLLTSYVGKFIIQCPQCMTLFYKNSEDIVESEDDSTVVNENEVCQHCGNESGYTLIGKVGEAAPGEFEEEPTEETAEEVSVEDVEEAPDEEVAEESETEDLEIDESELADLELNLEDEEEETQESFDRPEGELLVEQLDEDVEKLEEDNLNLEIDDAEFEALINSTEFKKPITDASVRTMMKDMETDEKQEVEESLNTLTEASEKEIQDKLKEHNDYIDYLQKMIKQEEEALARATNEFVKEAIQRRLDAFKEDLEKALPDEVKDEVATEELPTPEEVNVSADDTEEVEESLLEDADLDEGVFDGIKTGIKKIKNKIDDKREAKKQDVAGAATKNLVSREEIANWILEYAREDNGYNAFSYDEGTKKLLANDSKQRFKTFVVIGFTDKYSNGQLITMAPSHDNKDLVVGKNMPQAKEDYKNAEKIAKGWSMQENCGPAFIYMAKDANDPNAAFLCSYFKGKLAKDFLAKYFKSVKDNINGGVLMSDAGMTQQTEEETPEATEESFSNIFDDLEELQESSLEKLIADSLIEVYDNVETFSLSDCSYLNEEFKVSGQIKFKSGATRDTTYVFTEALKIDEGIQFNGYNNKLGKDSKFTMVGKADDTKTFIAESFNYKQTINEKLIEGTVKN